MEVLFSLLIFHRALIIIWDDLILIVVNLKPSLVWSRSQSLLRSRCFNGTVKKDLWDLISSYLFSIVQNASLPSTLRNWFIASVLFFFDFHGSETLSYVWYYHENHDTMIKSFSWKLKYQACEDISMCCGLHVLSCHHRHCHWQVCVLFKLSSFCLAFYPFNM